MTLGPGRVGLRAWAGGAVLVPALLAFGILRPDDGSVPFFVLLGLASVGYLATLFQIANGLRPSGRGLVVCVALAAAWRIPMLLAPPEPAADLRRYLWDAHLVRAGLSPYAVIPADPAFAHLRTAETWPVNNPEVPSPYPPGAQLFFLAATAPAESARAIKLALFLCDALLALVVWRSLIVAGANPGWMLAYAWSPLVSLEVARHGHVDLAGALLVALAALALARGRALVGTIALALSIAVKPLSLVLLPLLWRRVSRWHVAAGCAALLVISLPFSNGHRPSLGSVPEVIERFRFNGPVFTGVAALAGPLAATGLAVLVGLAVAGWARRRLSLASPEAWAWPMAATILCAPLVYPWYLLWLAPFLVTPRTMPLAVWSVSILGTYVAWQRVGVPWGVPAWMLAVEYAALVAAAVWLWRTGVTSSARPRSRTPPASPPRS
jgi:hypothetical protein